MPDDQYVPSDLVDRLLVYMSMVEIAQHVGYGTRPVFFEARMTGAKPVDDAFIARLHRLEVRIERGQVETANLKYVPADQWKRITDAGLSYVHVARLLGEFPGTTLNRRLRGDLPCSDALLEKVESLVRLIDGGAVQRPKSDPRAAMNPGGHYSWQAEDYEPPLPPEPTTAPAGSAAKVQVMYERAAAGYALRHPLDNEMHAPIGSVAKMAAMMQAVADEDYDDEEDHDA